MPRLFQDKNRKDKQARGKTKTMCEDLWRGPNQSVDKLPEGIDGLCVFFRRNGGRKGKTDEDLRDGRKWKEWSYKVGGTLPCPLCRL